jgi:tetratricopeptide (TPR) repeat protein
MKRFIFFILVSLFILIPVFSSQRASEKDPNPIDSFVDAMKKQEGTVRINALKLYIKQFPETTSRWTRLAYFNIALEYYKIKEYAEAVKHGEKLFSIGKFGKGEEGRLALVIAESYGLKSSPVFNKKKAFQYINIAISAAKASNDKELLKAAQNLESQLSAAKQSTMSPEQKIKRLFSMKKFLEVKSYYETLNAADRSNPEIHKIYADAFFRLNRNDAAIKEFKTLYEKRKKAIYAYRLGTIYSNKANAKKNINKTLSDISANYFIEAGLLYREEGNINNQENAFGKAKAALSVKYGYNKLVKEYNEFCDTFKKRGKKNESAIREKKREIRKLKKEIRNYEHETGHDAPPYMYEDLNKKETELKELEAGGADFSKLAEYEKKIKELNETIQRELQDIRSKGKKNG